MSDKDILKDLVKQYVEICSDPVQDERRNLWRQHNSLKKTPPLVYTRAFAWNEMEESKLQCEDPLFRSQENMLRKHLFWHTINDDSVFEPWLTVRAVFTCTGWGVETPRHTTDDEAGSFKIDYPIKELDDIKKLREPQHEINEQKTKENADRIQDAVGDIITVNIDRSPAYWIWGGDLSTDLGYLRGIEHIMMDMFDNPEWLHSLLTFMSDGVLKTHEQAEQAGDWGLSSHYNQAMAYAEELEDPAPNINGVIRDRLWIFMPAQELTGVSPEMHDEFMLQYQLPIVKQFGLTAYGCCEDLTHKIDILRQIPNLRRIAVSPFADAAKCAEQIGQDYVLSYRPSPTDMVGYGFDPDRIRSILKRDLEACKDTHVDITLKDVETVEKDPDRVRKWVELTRQIIDEVF
jgi:hypothetical protein